MPEVTPLVTVLVFFVFVPLVAMYLMARRPPYAGLCVGKFRFIHDERVALPADPEDGTPIIRSPSFTAKLYFVSKFMFTDMASKQLFVDAVDQLKKTHRDVFPTHVWEDLERLKEQGYELYLYGFKKWGWYITFLSLYDIDDVTQRVRGGKRRWVFGAFNTQPHYLFKWREVIQKLPPKERKKFRQRYNMALVSFIPSGHRRYTETAVRHADTIGHLTYVTSMILKEGAPKIAHFDKMKATVEQVPQILTHYQRDIHTLHDEMERQREDIQELWRLLKMQPTPIQYPTGIVPPPLAPVLPPPPARPIVPAYPGKSFIAFLFLVAGVIMTLMGWPQNTAVIILGILGIFTGLALLWLSSHIEAKRKAEEEREKRLEEERRRMETAVPPTEEERRRAELERERLEERRRA
jgi:hypothetical protein